MQRRVLTGKQKLTLEEKETLREKKRKLKDKYESVCLGGFEAIYPLKKGISPEQDQLQYAYEQII